MVEVAPTAEPSASPQETLATAGYEVVRRRLLLEAAELSRRAEQLNEARKREFGSVGFELAGNERVRTEHHCLPRDILRVGKHVVFAYQVFLGLKAETEVADVLGVYAVQRGDDGSIGFREEPLGSGEPGTPAQVFGSAELERDFRDVFKYTKNARILQLKRTDHRLLLAVQVGERVDDRKVFRFSLDASGKTAYIDARGQDDAKLPRAHDFSWTALGREAHVLGAHPHVSVAERVFVETVGGDLTIKIENNTKSGRGILSEPVEEARQTLDDAEFAYAVVGRLILLRIKPYREGPRYFIYDEASEQAHRVDAIGDGCLLLPEDHGVLFPGGYYVEGQGLKRFVDDPSGLRYEGKISAPNGEDVLFVFHRDEDGLYCLLPYNLIEKGVKNALLCHGFTLLRDGTMLVFKETSPEPSKLHPLQIWRTPFMTAEHAAEQPPPGSYLGTVGNAELVRGLAEALSLVKASRSEHATRARFTDLARACERFADDYFWAGHAEAHSLGEAATALGKTAKVILDEFEKERALQRRAEEALVEARTAQRELLANVSAGSARTLDEQLGTLADLRTARGQLVTLRDLRAMDLVQLGALDQELADAYQKASEQCVELLLGGEALKPTVDAVEAVVTRAEAAAASHELPPLEHELERTSTGLTLLSETLSALHIDDAGQKTRVLEETSEVFSHLNRARAVLRTCAERLQLQELQAEYGVRFKLLGQTLNTALAESRTVEATDERQARVLLALEELETRFGGVPEYAAELLDKRVEIGDAFAARRQGLIAERQQRAQQLMASAERVLTSVARRAASFTALAELQGYFAADPMVQKLPEIAAQLDALGDSVRAEELRGRDKAQRQEALRTLRDREDLGGELDRVRFGQHVFAVTTQALDLVLTVRDGGEAGRFMAAHVTGTDYFQRVQSAELDALSDLWEQTLPSESSAVYRAEHLAYATVRSRGEHALYADGRALSEEALLEVVRDEAQRRYDEGYDRGVHDVDAAKILHAWLPLRRGAQALRMPPSARALAALQLASMSPTDVEKLAGRARAAERLLRAFGDDSERKRLERVIAQAFSSELIDCSEGEPSLAARALVDELSVDAWKVHGSQGGAELHEDFVRELDAAGELRGLRSDLEQLASPAERFTMARAWLTAFAKRRGASERDACDAALRLACPELPHEALDARTESQVTGLLGQHAKVRGGELSLVLDEFEQRLARFVDVEVPRFRQLRTLRAQIVEREKQRLRLSELLPKTMSAFVRNSLIDGVYLPLIGANLAKQIGVAGHNKRTDQMGLLLLVSPPGYGKTTLMEYVAQRLGLIFMKINGPALGHEVSSLDPAAAPDATSRREVEKINLAFEMGQNVMLYLDDIQHTSPELLQKFISLCDAQRKIEGSWDGVTKTYDLRGKRFCVVMAGNPYTESGARFQIPDMLANRADTYNLGEVLDGKEELFLLSYVENALTANELLAPLAARDPKDVARLLDIAAGDESKKSDLSHPYSNAELNELSQLLGHLQVVRDVLAKVNAAYVRSASQDDAYRTSPPFKLQGSYRNMSKITEKVVASMNAQELEALITDHYRGEAQTLTKGAEENLLALGALRGVLGADEASRWAAIVEEYSRRKRFGDDANDPAAKVVGGLGLVEREIARLREGVPLSPEVLVLLRESQGAVLQMLQTLAEQQGATERLWQAQRESGERAAEILEMMQLQQVSAEQSAERQRALSQRLAEALEVLGARPAALDAAQLAPLLQASAEQASAAQAMVARVQEQANATAALWAQAQANAERAHQVQGAIVHSAPMAQVPAATVASASVATPAAEFVQNAQNGPVPAAPRSAPAVRQEFRPPTEPPRPRTEPPLHRAPTSAMTGPGMPFEFTMRTQGGSSVWFGPQGKLEGGGVHVPTRGGLPEVGALVQVTATMPSGVRLGLEGDVAYHDLALKPGAVRGFGIRLRRPTDAAWALLEAYAAEHPPKLRGRAGSR